MGPGQRRLERSHLALAAIVVFATTTWAWHLSSVRYSVYYSSSVRSMTASWHALLFGAFDPGATITVDKVPGAFVVQALFARVLGFHAWVLVLPQVLAGVVAVVVLHRLVRRWRGEPAGLVAAAVFATTPIVASTFAHTMEDGLLVCAAVLAVDRIHVAVTEGRLRSLLWAGFWVGVGFEMKMVQAWLLLPALAGAYLVCAPGSWRRRIVHSALATGVAVALSSWWVVLMELVPAGSRPYVDGSTDNSAFTMVFGFNGLERLGVHLPGVVRSSHLSAAATPPIAPWQTLVDGRLATQISWLLPLALVVLGAGLWATRRGPRTSREMAGLVVFGLWLLPLVIVMSVVNVPHAAYLVALAPPIAGLAGAGLAALPRWPRPVVTAALAGQAGWTAWVWTSYAHFAPWVLWLTLAAFVVALGLVWRGAVTIALLSMLIAPAAWALSTYDTAYAGTEIEAGAGPAPRNHPGVLDANLRTAFGEAGRSWVEPAPELSLDAEDLGNQAANNAPGVEYPVTTAGWYLAQSLILAGERVLPTGGFSLTVPAPSFDRFQALLRQGRVRFVLAGSGVIGGFVSRESSNGQIVTWVVEHCPVVTERSYGTSGVFLYDCAKPAG